MAVTEELDEVAVSSQVIDTAIILRKESRIKVPDAIIAASALIMRAVLLTRNVDDFKAVDMLSVINPWNI
ncbi:hypothetical protein [Desulfonatronum thioautotrophicum]|uniref:hypothetical protein n=1 Tax=Desulfonatronum thioautotrophicum TaxID=617001 RepID=UPI00069BE32B|nr:hypothetical protein [Desulfonatronum thioautotrophicum]